MPDRPARLAAFISGSGRTLLNIHDHIRAGDLSAEITLVVASRPCPGAEHAAGRGLPVRIIQGDIPPDALTHLLHEHAIDWVVLAGYLRKLPIAAGFEGRVVNIHPALLPRYGGPGMYAERVHAAVLASGDAESGCTVHLAGADYDTGPIILQKRCPVLPGDTPATLAARVFELETQAYPEALKLLIARSVP
jgi:phosphoribosylglycinamide formyltransferase-1